jgi:hypothetical protein
VSPILVRPVREQFEHDRVIRVLQVRYKRKFEVAINPGAEQNAAVSVGESTYVPDVLLYSPDKARRLQATIEVETTESINTLEAMAEWGPFSRLKVPFYLYVPPNAIDTARRLCSEHQIAAAEIWTYHTAVDQVRFTMVHRTEVPAPRAARSAERPIKKPAAKPAAKPTAKPAAKPANAAKPAKKTAAKTAQKAAPQARKAASRNTASAKTAKRR